MSKAKIPSQLEFELNGKKYEVRYCNRALFGWHTDLDGRSSKPFKVTEGGLKEIFPHLNFSSEFGYHTFSGVDFKYLTQALYLSLIKNEYHWDLGCGFTGRPQTVVANLAEICRLDGGVCRLDVDAERGA